MKNRINYFILAFLVSLSFLNCTGQNNSVLDANDFDIRSNDPNSQLLDVRTKEEFDNGHLTKALHANWNDAEEFRYRTASLDKLKPVYVYCLAGSRSAKAAVQLRQEGYNVYELQGGVNAWKAAGKNMEGKSKVVGMSLKDFNDFIKANPLTLVDFGAKWCPPCKKMNPLLDELATQTPNLTILRLDADRDDEVFKYFKVATLPVFVLFKEGQKVREKSGILEKDALKTFCVAQ